MDCSQYPLVAAYLFVAVMLKKTLSSYKDKREIQQVAVNHHRSLEKYKRQDFSM